MTDRIEAAAKALDPQTMGSGGAVAEKFKEQTRAEARRILAAADKVMFDEAAVERAARAMLDGLYSDKTLKIDDEDRAIISTVIAALKGDDA